jgi:hypothetical protein
MQLIRYDCTNLKLRSVNIAAFFQADDRSQEGAALSSPVAGDAVFEEADHVDAPSADDVASFSAEPDAAPTAEDNLTTVCLFTIMLLV